MNRSDLSWALKAAIPHAGKSHDTSGVGLYQDVAWATDSYTLGIARVADAFLPWCEVGVTEAKELERFVRPRLVAHKVEEVIFKRVGNELHIGLPVSEDTAVFDLLENGTLIPLGACIRAAIQAQELPPATFLHCPYDADFLARFADAKRENDDRMWFSQRKSAKHLLPIGVVTIGEDFLGWIAGLSVEDGHEWPTEPEKSLSDDLRAVMEHPGAVLL